MKQKTQRPINGRRDNRESYDVVSDRVRDTGDEKLSGSPAQETPAGMVSEKERTRIIGFSRRLNYLTLSNPKTIKGLERGWAVAILHLAPALYSGHKTCHRYGACAKTCLYHQGRGQMKNVQGARIRRTKDLFERYDETMCAIHSEIRWLHSQLRSKGSPHLAVRLNGMSDLKWEEMPAIGLDNQTLISASPDVQFYDYTKYKYGHRMGWTADGPINYHLTYSYDGSEKDIDNAKAVLKAGYNVHVVHNKVNYSKAQERMASNQKMWGYQMLDNEPDDLRFLDPRPAVLCGKEKGYSDIAI